MRRLEDLQRAFTYHPDYYRFEDAALNLVDLGLQNSRGFRALKVWLALRQVGRSGYERMIADDMRLARHLHTLAGEHPVLEPLSHSLSITTFRYVPADLPSRIGDDAVAAYLNELNEALLDRIEKSGQAFFSNAVIDGVFALRLCVVNFRTTLDDIEILPGLVSRLGAEVDGELRPGSLPS